LSNAISTSSSTSANHKARIKEGPTITINEFKNSNNQDTLYEDPPLATAETSDSHFNIQNKKALMQELV